MKRRRMAIRIGAAFYSGWLGLVGVADPPRGLPNNENIPTVEVCRTERGSVPDSIQRQIEQWEARLKKAITDRERQIAETKVAELKTRGEKLASVILLGRYMIGLDADRNRHDYPVEVELPGRYADAFSPGDFVQFRDPNPLLARGQNRKGRKYPDTQRVWINPAGIKQVERPEWWREGPGFDADFFVYDRELTRDAQLTTSPPDEIIHYPARGYGGVWVYSFRITNDGTECIAHARISIALLDGSGDLVEEKRDREAGGGVTSIHLENLEPGETTRIDIGIGSLSHQKFDHAEVWVRSLTR